ncbi:MAG TPA: hypothetical protein VK783_12420 [Bacteroidia bacterium]|nr:hypothetical protein [Bacteroidia bacterium]
MKYLIPLIGFILAGVFALLKIKSNTVSASRIKWILEITEALSEYLVSISKGLLDYQNYKIDYQKDELDFRTKRESYRRFTLSINKSIRLGYKIQLYLNSKNKLQNNLEMAIMEINHIIQEIFDNDLSHIEKIDEYRTMIDNKLYTIVSISKEVIEEERIKSKRLIDLD